MNKGAMYKKNKKIAKRLQNMLVSLGVVFTLTTLMLFFVYIPFWVFIHIGLGAIVLALLYAYYNSKVVEFEKHVDILYYALEKDMETVNRIYPDFYDLHMDKSDILDGASAGQLDMLYGVSNYVHEWYEAYRESMRDNGY